MNYRYEAIAWLANIKEKYIHGGDEEFDECRRESIDMAIKALRQPQIVRCKDCKAWEQYDDMNLGECELYPEYNKMGDWFCNFGERK